MMLSVISCSYISGQVIWFIKTALEKALRTKRKSSMELKIVSSNKKIKRDPSPFGFPCMEALFDMFMRADIKRHRNIEGSGLGLTIAKELCEQMGGHIQAESIYGKGSNFTVYFPLKDAGTEKIGQWKVVEGEPVQEKRKKFFA